MKFVFKTLYYGVVCVLSVVAVSLIVPILPISGNYQVRVVLSGSMEPSIKTGSVVYVRSYDKYNVGDVITFTAGSFKGPKGESIPITHRILEIKDDNGTLRYVTKGDSNEEADTSMVSHNAVMGKVFFNIPYVGYAIETARQPYGFLALILFPAAIIIWDQSSKIWKEVSSMREKSYEED